MKWWDWMPWSSFFECWAYFSNKIEACKSKEAGSNSGSLCLLKWNAVSKYNWVQSISLWFWFAFLLGWKMLSIFSCTRWPFDYFLVNFPKSRVSSLEIMSGPRSHSARTEHPLLSWAYSRIFPHPSCVPSLPAFPRRPALINFLVGMDSGPCLLNAGWKSFAKAVITHTHRTACLFLHYM